jgi:hypothetical protein
MSAYGNLSTTCTEHPLRRERRRRTKAVTRRPLPEAGSGDKAGGAVTKRDGVQGTEHMRHVFSAGICSGHGRAELLTTNLADTSSRYKVPCPQLDDFEVCGTYSFGKWLAVPSRQDGAILHSMTGRDCHFVPGPTRLRQANRPSEHDLATPVDSHDVIDRRCKFRPVCGPMT